MAVVIVCRSGVKLFLSLKRKVIKVKSYVELVPADPNIPNGILSTGDNLKCLKRLTAVQTGDAACVTDSDLEIMPMQN